MFFNKALHLIIVFVYVRVALILITFCYFFVVFFTVFGLCVCVCGVVILLTLWYRCVCVLCCFILSLIWKCVRVQQWLWSYWFESKMQPYWKERYYPQVWHEKTRVCVCVCAIYVCIILIWLHNYASARLEVSIGRDLGNTIVIPDAGVSRSHARIEWKDHRTCWDVFVCYCSFMSCNWCISATS